MAGDSKDKGSATKDQEGQQIKETPQPPVSIENPYVGIPKIYSNAIKIDRSVYEFQLILGQAVKHEVGEAQYQLIEPKAIMFLSPEHAKVLARMLSESLSEYEKQFGPIPEQRKEAQKAN